MNYEEELKRIQDMQKQQDLWLEEQRKIQEEQIRKDTEQQVNYYQQQKIEADKELEKEGKAAQVDYLKSINPYGVERESLVQAGLGNTGYSESTRTQHYNTMQNRISNAINTITQVKADFDNKIAEARLTGDKLKAQLALEEYNQKIQNAWQALQLQLNIQSQAQEQRNWEKQFELQKQAQAQQQSNWERQFARQNEINSLREQLAYYQNQAVNFTDSENNVQQIETDYYKGPINPDTQYGTFKTTDKYGTRYQPNNINGVPLKSSGKKVYEMAGGRGNVNSSGVNVDNQTVWQIGNNYYIWNGSKNKYEQVVFN